MIVATKSASVALTDGYEETEGGQSVQSFKSQSITHSRTLIPWLAQQWVC